MKKRRCGFQLAQKLPCKGELHLQGLNRIALHVRTDHAAAVTLHTSVECDGLGNGGLEGGR